MKTAYAASTPKPPATHRLLALGPLCFLLGGSLALAQDVWTGGGPDGLWSTNANWSTPPPPQTHEDIIMAGPGHLVNTADTAVSGSAPREWTLHTILFPSGAPNFLIHVGIVTIEPTATPGGIFNSSGRLQIFDMDPGNVFTNTTAGVLTLQFTTVGEKVLLQNLGGTVANPESGITNFFGASAGLATINNFGGFDGLHASGGQTVFGSSGATAGNASIANLGGDSVQGSGGSTLFKDNATGGHATIHNLGATAQGALGGSTTFTGVVTGAGSAEITNDGADVIGALSEGRTYFLASASADFATITNQAGRFEGGETLFFEASASRALVINRGSGFFGQPGRTIFDGHADAGQAVIVNEGGDSFLGNGGITSFNVFSDAGSATLIAQAGAPSPGPLIPGGLGGRIYFNDQSTGGTADVQVLGNGAVDISGHVTPNVTIGTIEGDGQAFLGANNLSVGSGSTTHVIFYGSLHDGGASGGTGGSFTKVGSGIITLAGTSDYTGATTVAAGKLLVDGSIAASSRVTVGAGATLGGHGTVSSIGGAGTIAPGDSPGILTATQLDPTGGADFAFELTQVGSPTYSNAAASGNDLLHLTAGIPFTAPLTSANQIAIDFSGASLAEGQIYLGGFFTDAAIDNAMVDGATFLYTGLDGFTVQFDGFVTEPTADFAGGTVLNGDVMRFEIGQGTAPVPDLPSTGLLVGLGVISLLGVRALRNGRRPSLAMAR